jgi:hypothetical protein
MDLAMLLLTIATAVLAGGSFWAAVHYGRKALAEARNANALASERSVVDWQVDRMAQDNAGWFYAANTGQDTAYEVTVFAWDADDRVRVQADSIRPNIAEADPEAEGGHYIDFRLPERERNGPKLEAGPPPRVPTPGPPLGAMGDYFAEVERHQDEMIVGLVSERERNQVWVRITWRSEMGRWSTEELQTG